MLFWGPQKGTLIFTTTPLLEVIPGLQTQAGDEVEVIDDSRFGSGIGTECLR